MSIMSGLKFEECPPPNNDDDNDDESEGEKLVRSSVKMEVLQKLFENDDDLAGPGSQIPEAPDYSGAGSAPLAKPAAADSSRQEHLMQLVRIPLCRM